MAVIVGRRLAEPLDQMRQCYHGLPSAEFVPQVKSSCGPDLDESRRVCARLEGVGVDMARGNCELEDLQPVLRGEEHVYVCIASDGTPYLTS